MWTIVLLFLLKSHIKIFQLTINLRLAALCTVLIHLGIMAYYFYDTHVLRKVHKFYTIPDYIETIFNDVLIVTANIFLLAGSIKLKSKYVLLWICQQIYSFTRVFMVLVYITNNHLVFKKSSNPFQKYYVTLLLNFGETLFKFSNINGFSYIIKTLNYFNFRHLPVTLLLDDNLL